MAITIQPLDSAIEYLRKKTPVTSPLRTDGWERVALDLRDRAQFSAGIESIRIMTFIQQRLEDVLSHARTPEGTLRDRSEFVRDMMSMAREEGALGPGQRGTLADASSEARAELIYRQQTSQAYGYANWQAGQDTAALESAPAQELIRLEERRVKRVWHERWRAAGGTIYPGAGQFGDGREGRLIALKTDPVWARLSRFGSPWPPYDFNSGVWVEDVFRDEAEALGLIEPGAPAPEPVIESFNKTLEADVTWIPEKERKWLVESFGDQIGFEGGHVVWQGEIMRGFFEKAIEDPHFKQEKKFGFATRRAVELGKSIGVNLEGAEMRITADDIRHEWDRHGPSERSAGQAPLTELDFEVLPHLWRDPDELVRGEGPDHIRASKRILGKTVGVLWHRKTKGQKTNVWMLNTVYKKVSGG